MAQSNTTTTTLVVKSEDQEEVQEEHVLRLRAPPSPPHVTWAEGVVGMLFALKVSDNLT